MRDIAALLQVEENCRNAQSILELKYILTNETGQLLDYDKAVLLSNEKSAKLKVQTISDISSPDSNTPFVQWIQDLAKKIKKTKYATSVQELTVENDFTSSNILWVPLLKFQKSTKIEFYLLFFKNEQWQQDEKKILEHVASSYSHFLYALTKNKLSTWFLKKIFSTSFKLILLSALVFIMFLPVRLSVLAPLEVQAKNPLLVTSPLNGAIQEVSVVSNQELNEGDLLFKIKDTEYKNNYEIAKRTLEITRSQLRTTEQNSFVNPQLKSQIPNLQAEVKLKREEVKYAKYQYDLTNIYAKKSGLVIIDDPNQWRGRPVVIGEKILLIADKKKIELQVMLSVSDAIFFDKDAEVKIFFDNDPLNTFHASVSKIYYEPVLTPQNILSYKIIVDLDNTSTYVPKIGLRGTAKIYAEEVTLFFYLFKKPITSLRQLVGW